MPLTSDIFGCFCRLLPDLRLAGCFAVSARGIGLVVVQTSSVFLWRLGSLFVEGSDVRSQSVVRTSTLPENLRCHSMDVSRSAGCNVKKTISLTLVHSASHIFPQLDCILFIRRRRCRLFKSTDQLIKSPVMTIVINKHCAGIQMANQFFPPSRPA